MGAQDGKKLPIHSVQFSINHFLLLLIIVNTPIVVKLQVKV